MMYEHYLFGEFARKDAPLNREDLEHLCVLAERASGKLQELPMDKILDVLELTAQMWLDPDYHLRKTALELLPPILKSSRAMVEEAITSLFTAMQRENLNRLLRGHLGRSSYLEDFEYVTAFEGYIKAQPLGVVLHMCPECSFFGGIDNLLYSFLTKNVSILKVSQESSLAPFLFARSLQEIDEEGYLFNSFSVISFPETDSTHIPDILKQRCDGIVVSRCRETARLCTADLSPETRFIFHSPSHSFSIITAEGFQESDPDDVFKRCARDVILWEQRASTSPHVIYVQKSIAEEFMTQFPQHLDMMNRRFPQQNLTMDEKIRILEAREFARFEELEGSTVLHHSPRSSAWTVIYEESPGFKLSPRNRTVYVKPFVSWADILGQAVKIKGNLHTVGVLVTPSQLKTMAKALAKMGVSRITRVGSMGDEKPGAPRSYDFPLRQLVRWIAIETVDKRFDLGERVEPPRSTVSRWERLRTLVRHARDNSIFYRNHFKDVDFKNIDSYEAFIKVPFLTREHIFEHAPPSRDEMLTAHLSRAYIFSGGDGTADSGFNVYGIRELDEVSSILSDIYQLADLTRDDTVLNLFMSGVLSTPFIVSNLALDKIGCVNLPVAGNADIDHILRFVTLFKPTTVVGPLSSISRLAEEIKKRSMDTRIEKVLFGGENFEAATINHVKESLGARLIRSSSYASNEAGLIGYQCRENALNVFHLLYEYVFLEIIDPVTLEPLENGETGEIVVTNFSRRLMPVIRYRTGSMGTFIPQRCSCGRQNPLFEVVSR